eukprot:gene3326-5212_t
MNWGSSTHKKRLDDVHVVMQRAEKRLRGVSQALRLCWDLCERYGPPVTLQVFSTAAMFLLRYYCRTDESVAHRTKEDDKYIFTSTLYAAMKCNDCHATIHEYTARISELMVDVSSAQVASFELDVLESVGFDFAVHSPFRVLEVLKQESSERGCDFPERMAVEGTARLLCAAPLFMCFAPSSIAVAGAGLAVAQAWLQRQDTPTDYFDHLPLVSHASSARGGTGLRTIHELIAHWCHLSGISLQCGGLVEKSPDDGDRSSSQSSASSGGGSEDPECPSAKFVLARHWRRVSQFLEAGDLLRLRLVCRDHHSRYAGAFWSAYAVVGSAEPLPATPSVLHLHPAELRVLKLVGLQLPVTGSATVQSHAFSQTAVDMLRQMPGADKIKL